jgi:uncharacterized membrane protein YedE/YeeE
VTRRAYAVVALCGALMAIGLALGHLTRPEVIIGWVDLFGHWDPTMLIFFVAGVAAYHLMLRWARARARRGEGPALCLPTKRTIDAPLIVGAGIFGVGWGLGGVCPGPGLTSFGAGASWAVPFVVAMIVGLALGGRLVPRRSS